MGASVGAKLWLERNMNEFWRGSAQGSSCVGEKRFTNHTHAENRGGLTGDAWESVRCE